MSLYHGVFIIYLLHSGKFYHGVNAVCSIFFVFKFKLLKTFSLGHIWNTKDCSTVNTRREFLIDCINQFNETLNSTIGFDSENLIENNLLYENCSAQLTKLQVVSPAQEYFQ